MEGAVGSDGRPDDRREAARRRVDAFLEALDHVGIDVVEGVSLPVGDIDLRTPARQAAVDAAGAAGLASTLADARERARARVVRMYDRNMYQPTWAGLNWGRSLGTVEDRVAVAAAVEDAAIGTVASDVAAPEDVATLTEPWRLIDSLRPAPTTRSQFAGTAWTGRVGAALYLVFVITTVAVLGAMFGVVGWIAAAAITVATAVAIRRERLNG